MSKPSSGDMKDRVAVVERVIHQEAGRQPVEIPTKFSRELKGSGEHYSRRLRVGDAFRPLDLGWIKDTAGMVLVRNLEGTVAPSLQPTPQEVEIVKGRILEIAYLDSEFWFDVPPGESLRINPSHADKLTVRCRGGEAEYQLIAFPR